MKNNSKDKNMIQARLTEFSVLREEVLFNLRMQLSTLWLCILLSSGIIIFGFKESNGFVFIVAIVVILSLITYLEICYTMKYINNLRCQAAQTGLIFQVYNDWAMVTGLRSIITYPRPPCPLIAVGSVRLPFANNLWYDIFVFPRK